MKITHCNSCKGTGIIIDETENQRSCLKIGCHGIASWNYHFHYFECGKCGHTFTKDKMECEDCNGTGHIIDLEEGA